MIRPSFLTGLAIGNPTCILSSGWLPAPSGVRFSGGSLARTITYLERSDMSGLMCDCGWPSWKLEGALSRLRNWFMYSTFFGVLKNKNRTFKDTDQSG
jgi:hypothetical protein